MGEDVEQSADFRRLATQLLEHRDDSDTWSVLGDLLLAHGHPRGELAALDRELRVTTSNTPRYGELLAHRTALFAAHRELLLGPDALLGDLRLTWRGGYVQRAQVPNTYIHADCVRALRSHASGQFLEELDTHVEGLRGYLTKPGAPLTHLLLRGASAWEGELASLVGAEALPAVRSVTFGFGVNVAVEGLRLPRLERVELMPRARVNGLAGLLRQQRVASLIIHDASALAELDAKSAPDLVIIEGRLSDHEFDVLIAAARRGAVRALDLEQCELSSAMAVRLVAALQGSLKGIEVRVSSALRRQPRLKGLLQRRRGKR